ncbi:MAG TPA: hypothetical protein DCQ83_05310 [Fibrobacteres bacterium]|nr:hypothetical protein [Fibrobacterota bacterium]
MQSLFEYLASAPKTHLAKVYRRDNPDAGLVQSARIVDDVQKRTLDTKRIKSVLAGMEPEARRLLLAIYTAEERGMLESELVRGGGGGSAWTGYWLGQLEYEQLIFCREGEHRSYHGFREMAAQLLPALLTEFAPTEEAPTGWISNAPYATAHLCHFLGRAALGELRLTQAGELHRKSLQELSKGFISGENLSLAVAEDEAAFLFRFAVDSGLLLEEDGILRLSSSASAWLEEDRTEIARRMREWWIRKRVQGAARFLTALSEQTRTQNSCHAVSALVPWFSVYEGWDKARARVQTELFTWENLPKTLRELWLIGGVEFALRKGRIRSARVLPPPREHSDAPYSSELPRGLPNFEALVPVGAPLNRQFQIELLAMRDNDEMLTRYRFSKDSVVAGLRAGISEETLEELASWLGFEAPAQRALAEWAASYVSAVFRELFVLQVRDAERFRELEEFPQFMQLVSEIIPGYGFVLPKAVKETARELLRAFDLLPGEEALAERAGRAISPNDEDSQWLLPGFVHGEILYRYTQPARREPPPLGDTERKGRAEETPEQRLEALDMAIRSQRSVEFAFAESPKKRIQVQPLRVLRDRDPMKLIAVESSTGHRNEYLLDQLQNLRLVEEPA